MYPRVRTFVLLIYAVLATAPLSAQLPFYTDDPAVTERGKWHFEFFNEFDALQRSQYPNLRQNTANYKINYGLPHNLEIDLDTPYLAIIRTLAIPTSSGAGDTNLGIKWNFHKESKASRLPALGVSLYFEFPTGDASKQLGSGVVDYWLNVAGQKSLSDKTRINGNLGYLFAGDTSTGALGLQTTRGHVYTMGGSVLHDFTKKLSLGSELYGAFTTARELSRTQFQVMLGGQYSIRKGLTFNFGLLGGKYVGSPRIGAQLGFSMDFPDGVHPPSPRPGSFH